MNNTEIDQLAEKLGGRYKLTVLIQKRLKELVKGAQKLVDLEDRNIINIVLEEIHQGKIGFEGQQFEEELKKEGKPEKAIPNIVEGKLRKLFYQAFCLNEQVSMRDNKTPLRKIIEEKSKAAGGKIEVKRFVRYQLGGE